MIDRGRSNLIAVVMHKNISFYFNSLKKAAVVEANDDELALLLFGMSSEARQASAPSTQATSVRCCVKKIGVSA